MKISGAVITKNEENNIVSCLKSLKMVCDEILVLDSGSTDNTIKLALGFGANVVQHDWQGFEVAKNKLNELANHPYVLNLDADEALSPELIEEIKKIKENLTGVYAMPRLTKYCGRYIKTCGWYPDKKVRLFPRELKWKGGELHEYPDTQDYGIVDLTGDILHNSYPTVESHKEKIVQYAALGASKLKGTNRAILYFKYLFTPPFKFLKMYFLKGGIRDGKLGFTICKLSAWGQRLRYKLALERD